MMNERFPFKNFGQKLKDLREQRKESLAEVSGAVEIDETELVRIEKGEQLPSEDILLLLISHFGVKESDGRKLFDTARKIRQQAEGNLDEQFIKQMLMVIPMDNRVLYSDNANVNVNDNGVIINFLQSNGKNPVPAARVGMSKEHAKKLAKIINDSIEIVDKAKKPKLLDKPKKDQQQI